MKIIRSIQWVILTLLIITGLIFINYRQEQRREIMSYPSLPRPIAEEMLLITSAGQTTDTYIIKDIANELRIHNYFMPQATDLDIEDINSIAVVVGYSDIGERLHEKTLEDEVERIEGLLKLADNQEIEVITFYIGGQHQRSTETDELLAIVCDASDYIVITEDGDYDHYITTIAEDNDVPMTIVDDVTNVSEPFASAFR